MAGSTSGVRTKKSAAGTDPAGVAAAAMPPKSTAGRKGGAEAASSKTTKSQKAGLTLPVGRITRMLKKGKFAKRISSGAPIYLTAAVEWLLAELICSAAEKTRERKRTRITPRDVMLSVEDDEEFRTLLGSVIFTSAGVKPHVLPQLLTTKDKAKKIGSVSQSSTALPSDEESEEGSHTVRSAATTKTKGGKTTKRGKDAPMMDSVDQGDSDGYSEEGGFDESAAGNNHEGGNSDEDDAHDDMEDEVMTGGVPSGAAGRPRAGSRSQDAARNGGVAPKKKGMSGKGASKKTVSTLKESQIY